MLARPGGIVVGTMPDDVTVTADYGQYQRQLITLTCFAKQGTAIAVPY